MKSSHLVVELDYTIAPVAVRVIPAEMVKDKDSIPNWNRTLDSASTSPGTLVLSLVPSQRAEFPQRFFNIFDDIFISS